MSKIAIDVVLLPPEDIMDKAIEINSQLVDDPIKLNKKNCLPHISLCMGVIEEDKLPEVNKILDKIGKDFPPLNLTIFKLNSENVCFDLEITNELKKIHEKIMINLVGLLSYDATVDTCYKPPAVEEKAIRWINKYKEQSSFENFYPHITLGVSQINERNMKINFVADRLAICHLGNYCTCRKILHEIKLKYIT